jgi:flagellin-like hook-associated protein FlgL
MNNDVLIEMRQRQYEDVLAQIDELVNDASYRGQNILVGDDITTYFNERRTSSLVIEGDVFTSSGLNLLRNDFDNEDDLNAIRDNLRTALERVRNFGSGLVNNLTILEGRRDMSFGMSITLTEGADKLTLADMNQTGASFLAAQTRLSLGVTALNLANFSNRSILSLFA